MKYALPSLILISALSVNGQALVPPAPGYTLTVEDKQRILKLLNELKRMREMVALQAQFIDQDRQTDDRERDLAKRELEVHQRLTAIAERERDQARERADTFEKAYNDLKKVGKLSRGCAIKKIFSLGLIRCN